MSRIKEIIFDHEDGTYELWHGFSLTEEEESAIQEILSHHIHEGESIRGNKKEIAKMIREV